jgi:RNA polymerase sigma factor (sigma-70 family)
VRPFKLSLPNCIPLIASYRETDDTVSFLRLLAQFDLLLVDTIHGMRRRYHVLLSESTQDMYHTAIVAFARSLKKIDMERPELIPATIKAYVVSAIRKQYSYKEREIEEEEVVLDWFNVAPDVSQKRRRVSREQRDAERRLQVSEFMDAAGLTKEEEECVIKKFLGNSTLNDVAKDVGLTKDQVRYRIKTAMRKLRRVYLKNRGEE